jgi:hypothetical protein
MSADGFRLARGRVLGVVSLAAALGAAGLPAMSGEKAHARPRVARRISQPALEFRNPLGLAYSPAASDFLVAPAEGPSRLQGVTQMAETAGVGALELAGADALNLTFDGHRGRLLALSGRWLLAVPADGRGRPGRRVSQRFDVGRLGVGKPAGMAVDRRTGTLFVLDASIPRLVQVEPTSDGGLESGAVSYMELYGMPAEGVNGLALDPGTGHLFLLGGTQKLYEARATGELLQTHDISDARLKSPGGMVVAPTGDQTDDPSAQSLYVADAGSRSLPGAIVELTFAPTATAQAVATFTSSVVTQTLTSQWTPPAPDTSDVVYLPASNTLLVVDSEVEEMPIWAGVNAWETTLGGSVLDTADMTPPGGFTDEPTGISVNPANGHLFVSDDDVKKIFEIDPGLDGLYNTTDDIRTSFGTKIFGSTDPEDVTYHPGEGVLYFADGLNAEVYRLAPGANGVFDGVPPAGDDQLTQFDVSAIVTDPECLTLNTENGHLYIAGVPDTIVQEITTSGALVQTIDISAAAAKNTAGLGFGPGSTDPTARRLYVVQRGVDNNGNPNENDGKLWEMSLPGSGGPGNAPPVVSAGSDQSIALPASASLSGSVSDDGLPSPPASLTVAWSKLSGPGTVTFANPNAVATTASFSGGGTYVLRLTASDSVLSASDDVVVTVGGATALWVERKDAIHSSLDASSYAFASITASNAHLYVVFLNTSTGIGAAPWATSVSGAGLSFTEIGTGGGLAYSGTGGVRRIQAWRALSTAGASTGAITIQLNGVSTSMDAVLLEVSGADTSGTNGSGAIAQSATAQTAVGTSLTVPLAPFGSPENRPVAFFSHRVEEASTEEAGYTELDEAFHNTPSTGTQSEWHATAPDASPSASWLTAEAGAAFALEVRSAAAAPTINQLPVVSAGPDQGLTLPATASLNGTVSDDGLPDPPRAVTTTWDMVSGPASVTFSDAGAVDTTASFSTNGVYVLRLTASDGELTASDDVTLTVIAAGELSVATKSTIHEAGDASSYAFAPVTAGNALLYVVFLNTSSTSGAAPVASSVSGAGLSFTEIGVPGGLAYSAGAGVRRIQAWRALTAVGAGAGSITIALDGISTSMDAVLLEISGVDTSGVNGSGAIVQSATGQANLATSLAVALAAFESSDNRPLAFFSHRVDEATVEAPGYVELVDASHAQPATGVQCEWHGTVADSTPSASWPTVGDAGGFALELRTAPNNHGPLVNAGPDQTIAAQEFATLSGTVSDDGLPNPPGVVSTTWTKASGPGTVTFGDAGQVATSASFSTGGSYVLRLTAYDGALSSSDTVTVTVDSLSVVKRDAIHTATDANSYSFAPIIASNQQLYVVFLNTSIKTGVAPSATSVAGAGLAFTEIGSPGGVLYSGRTGARRIQAWRALASAGATSGSITINLDATSTSMDAVLLEVSGVDTSGTNGSGAIVQSASSKAKNVTSLSVPLAAFGSPDNRPLAFFSHRAAEATTEEPGHTELDDATHGAPSTGAQSAWHSGAADASPSASWLTAAHAGGFAVELRRASIAPPSNQFPVVSAGPDQSITLPSSASLDGAVSDDGLPDPPGTLTTTWSVLSGPGTVSFGNPAAVNTTVSFSTAGSYVLRLSADDTSLSASDDITVLVNPVPPLNQPPGVSAGPDQGLTLPASASLDGTVSDDGLPSPPGTLTIGWSMVSGPGTVTFGDASALDTTASFSVDGSYVLRLTASDGELSASDDITVTVTAAGQLSVVTKAAIHDAGDAGSYEFASVTTSDDRLYLVFLNTSVTTGTAPSATSVSGAGLSFTEIGAPGGRLYSGASGARRIQAWRALSAAGAGAGSVTINLDGTSTSMDAVLVEVSGVDASGTNGSRAIGQSATAQANNVTSLGVALAAFGGVDNRPLAFFSHRVAEATTEGPGYTELDGASHISPDVGTLLEWHGTAANATPSASWLTPGAAGGFAIEVRSANAPPINQAPLASAGPDQAITLPASASLNGTISDDGLPNPPGALLTAWSVMSGPGTVTFGDPSVVVTTASFSTAGSYVLRLTAGDSVLSTSDDVIVVVNPAPPVNQPPAVDAGSDQSVTLPGTASLDGTLSDDGLPNPPGTLTAAWSVVSGPGTVTFGDASAADTTASFSVDGSYVLRLTAGDGELSASDDISLTVSATAQLSVAKKASIHDAGDASAYAFASVAASDNLLYVVFVNTSVTTGTAPSATNVSGAGLTFTEIGAPGGLPYSGGGVRRLQAWRALASTGAGVGSITITLDGPSTSMDAVLLEVGGVDTSGTNGSGAIGQSATNQANNVPSLSVPLAAFANPDNRPLAFFSHRFAEPTTEGSGYTELDDANHISPSTGAQTEWHALAADTTPSASWVTAGTAGGFAVELRVGSTP